MTTKMIAGATSVCALCLYVFSTLIPNDPFFYLISSNFGIVILRSATSLLLLSLAFKKGFYYKMARPACLWLAATLSAFGLAGLLILPLDYALVNTVMPLDYIFAAGSGFFLGFLSLSLKPGKAPLPALYLQSLQPRLAIRLARSAH